MVDDAELRKAITAVYHDTEDKDSLTMRMVKDAVQAKLRLEPSFIANKKALFKEVVEELFASNGELNNEPAKVLSEKPQNSANEHDSREAEPDDAVSESDKDSDVNQTLKKTNIKAAKPKPNRKEKPEKRDSGKQVKISDKDQKKIENLKKYIKECGERVPAKELAGMKGKEIISNLSGILVELGITDRPTLEKCRAVKQKRDFEKERQDLDLGNIITDSRKTRATRSAATTKPGDSDDDTEALRHARLKKLREEKSQQMKRLRNEDEASDQEGEDARRPTKRIAVVSDGDSD
ncbi:hypothetical protein BJ742DRAFT_814089 [Cladochytrium replicatum]|nr:hypothetical protein BJ742DRAFT_814089 [Cladochytrium replicatum]